MMISLYRMLFAAAISYCLFIAPAFAAENAYKPFQVSTLCVSPEPHRKIVETIRRGDTEAAFRAFSDHFQSGLCIKLAMPVYFLGEKVVETFGDLSEYSLETGNVIIEGVLLGWPVDMKAYVWVDDKIHSKMKLLPEVKS